MTQPETNELALIKWTLKEGNERFDRIEKTIGAFANTVNGLGGLIQLNIDNHEKHMQVVDTKISSFEKKQDAILDAMQGPIGNTGLTAKVAILESAITKQAAKKRDLYAVIAGWISSLVIPAIVHHFWR